MKYSNFKWPETGGVHNLFPAFLMLLLSVLIVQAQTLQKQRTDYVQLKAPDGTVQILKSTADDDEDGIENALEVNGYTYTPLEGLQAWDGDSSKNYYITDPLRWSTDGDPYSDFTEVTGVNMHPAVTWPENHPLVASSPIIVVKMPEYSITPNGEITDTDGGSQSETTTHEASVGVEVGYEETVTAEAGTGGISASASATLSMSVSSSYTFSSSVNKEVNWSKSRSVNPSEAAYLSLGVYFENQGSAPIYDVEAQFNVVVGQKVIATITSPETINTLAPGERFPDETSSYVVIEQDKNNNQIPLTMDELKSIQLGAPISLVVTQVDGKIGRWNSDSQSFENDVDWSSWKSNIDPVVVNIHADLGDGEKYLYRVYAGTDFYDPGFTFGYLVSKVFDVEKTGTQYQIEDRNYPGNWYMTSPSPEVQDEWNNQGRPDNIMELPMHPNTIISMKSPGADPSPDIILATFTPDFKHVIVNATPRGFPILSVDADVTVDGEKQTVTLEKNGAFYKNSEPFDLPADPKGKVYVKNSRGDVSEATTILPAFYRSAREILEYPNGILPIPGGDEYLLFVGGDTTNGAVIYCDFSIVEIDTIAREFYTMNSSGINPVAYTEVNAYDEQHRYQFQKIRINPRTLKFAVDNRDFVEREVIVGNGSAYSNYPELGRVVWTYPEIDSARSVLDLSNTPFYFAENNVFNNDRYSTVIIDKSRKQLMVERKNLIPLSNESYGFSGIATDSIQLALEYERVPIGEGLADNGNAVQINAEGTDGYINAWGGESLRLTGDFTIEAWIYPTGPGIDPIWGGIIVNREGEYEIARMPDGTIQWAIGNASPGWIWTNTQYEAPENQWVHLALVYDQSVMKAYFNGVLFATHPATGGIGDRHTNLNHFRIGGRQGDTDQSFQGNIDEVRIWNRVRSAPEIYSTFKDTLNPAYYATSDSGLIGYWRLDAAEDTGEGVLVTEDLSVNGNDGWMYGDVQLTVLPTGLDERASEVPINYSLNQNFPNPFNPVTTIQYRITKPALVELSVYNTAGQKIRNLVNDYQIPGNYTLNWDGTNSFSQPVASGFYVYRLSLDGRPVQSRRMVLIR